MVAVADLIVITLVDVRVNPAVWVESDDADPGRIAPQLIYELLDPRVDLGATIGVWGTAARVPVVLVDTIGNRLQSSPQRDAAGLTLHVDVGLPARVGVPELRLAVNFLQHRADIHPRLHQGEVLEPGRDRWSDGWEDVDDHPDRPLVARVPFFVWALVVEPDDLPGAGRQAFAAALQPAPFRRVEHDVEPVADEVVVSPINVAVDLAARPQADQHGAPQFAFQIGGDLGEPGHRPREPAGDFRIAARVDRSVGNSRGLCRRRDPQENRLSVSLTGDLVLTARVAQPAVFVRFEFVLEKRQVTERLAEAKHRLRHGISTAASSWRWDGTDYSRCAQRKKLRFTSAGGAKTVVATVAGAFRLRFAERTFAG